MCDCMAVDFADYDLNSTIDLMLSPDHKMRFVGEVMQNLIRMAKLRRVCRDIYDKKFTPDNPMFVLYMQIRVMEMLQDIYQERAKNENVENYYQIYLDYIANKNKAEEEKQ